jgi:hypothetical protein
MTYAANGLKVVGSTDLSDGRKVLRRPRVTLSDGNHTVGVTQGDRFKLPTVPAAPRTITLKSTSPAVPSEGESLEFLVPNVTASALVYTFQREDATVVATFVGSAVTLVQPMYAEFEFVGGVWRLGAHSGSAYDGSGDYGVLPGAGA